MPIPEDAEIGTFGSDAMVTLRSDWTPPGTTKAYVAGTLLALPMSDVMDNNWASALPLFEPTASKSLQSMTTTKDYVVLSVLEDVRTTLSVWKHESRPPTYTAIGRVAAVGVTFQALNAQYCQQYAFTKNCEISVHPSGCTTRWGKKDDNSVH